MAAKMIASTDAIEIKNLCALIFGGPGTGKTSLANTGEDVFLLDFDRGIHRSFNRKPTMQFDTWADVEAATPEIAKHKTVVVDTLERMQMLQIAQIVQGDSKNRTRTGGISLQGYGELARVFALWIAKLKGMGKDIILLAHEKEEKDGEDRYFRPEVVGKSYNEVHKVCDMMGYLYVDRSDKRTLSFKPGDRNVGKDSARIGTVDVGLLEENPHYMANLLADAKKRMMEISKRHQDMMAKEVAELKTTATGPPKQAAGKPPGAKPDYRPADLSAEEDDAAKLWVEYVKTQVGTPANLNEGLASSKEDLKAMRQPFRIYVWNLIVSTAVERGWSFNESTKLFEAK